MSDKDGKKGFTILVRSGTMMNTDLYIAAKLAEAGLKKGYKVRIFGYGEGVTLIRRGQGPKRFPKVEEMLKELIANGVEITVCETCTTARGLQRGEEFEGVRIGSLTNDLSRYVSETDKVITLAR